MLRTAKIKIVTNLIVCLLVITILKCLKEKSDFEAFIPTITFSSKITKSLSLNIG